MGNDERLARGMRGPGRAHGALHGGRSHTHGQREQFATDALCVSEPVDGGHRGAEGRRQTLGRRQVDEAAGMPVGVSSVVQRAQGG